MAKLDGQNKTLPKWPKQTKDRKWMWPEEEAVKAGGDPGEVRLWLAVAGRRASGGWSLHAGPPAGHSLDSSGRQLARYAGTGTGPG